MKKKLTRLISISLALCLLLSAVCLTAFATETCETDWLEYEDGESFYTKICREDANRSGFLGIVMAGRNTENRSSATRRMAAGLVIAVNNRQTRITIDTKDWATGAAISSLSGSATNNGFAARASYASPISVFACAEAWLTNGDYICVYPTSVAW